MKASKYAAEIMADMERGGLRLTPADVLRLNALGLQVECPCGEPPGVNSPAVVWAGAVPFYALTMQAANWQEVYASRWFREDYLTKAIAYAHAHGRDKGAFDGELTSKAGAKAVIDSWWRMLPCTDGEVWAAVNAVQAAELTETPAAKTDDDAPEGVHELLADIVAATGIAADVWRCEALSFVLLTYRAWARARAAEQGMSYEELKKSGVARATLAMAKAVAEINARAAANG